MEPLTRGQRRSEYQRQYREKHKEHLKELNEALYIKNYETIFKNMTVYAVVNTALIIKRDTKKAKDTNKP